MDRLEFISAIDHGNFVLSPNDIITFFDHIMAAYDLVGQYDIEILSTIDSPNAMSFLINFNREGQCEIGKNNKITQTYTEVSQLELYGKHFSVVWGPKGTKSIEIHITQI